MRSDRRRRGFTLAEMLISMALLAMIMVATALAIQAAESAHAYNAEKTELVARARGVLDRVALDVRRSASLDTLDSHILNITLADGSLRSYAWDGTSPGTLQYTETPAGGVQSAPAALTTYVTMFSAQDAQSGCLVSLVLTGRVATCHASITATPVKSLY